MNKGRNKFGARSTGRYPMIWLLIVSHIIAISGCSMTQLSSVTDGNIPADENVKITRVVMRDGTIIRFNIGGGKYIAGTTANETRRIIVGTTVDGIHVAVPLEKAIEVQTLTKSIDCWGTALLVIAGAAVGWLVILSIAFSDFD